MMATSPALAAARAARLAASDPAVSAFVGASAGSGKTQLLTDRLLRLMLTGSPPGRILCLTFTRAAAAEMALRLQRRLGQWVVMAEPALDADLAELGFAPTPAHRERARKLFAEVLDLPGGMRINTIHAFCQSVLRRFPLEAALSPHFEVADEGAALALNEAERRVLAGSPADVVQHAAINRLAPRIGPLETLGELMGALAAAEARYAKALRIDVVALGAAFQRAAGVPEVLPDPAALANEVALVEAVRTVIARGSPGVAKRAEAMAAWLALPTPARRAAFDDWRGHFLTGPGKPRAPSGLVNIGLAADKPLVLEALLAEQQRVLAVLEAEAAERAASTSADLFCLARPILATYAAEKEAAGRLDYADLIRRTRRLLGNPGAAWVLYKLDGGLDHLLLDEAQDTAPEQWAIADSLSAEFFAGHGARDERRTIFAVGDPKQSIFSFQGAEPAAFDEWRKRLGERVLAGGERWIETPLDVSFRSTLPVLALVDAVFAAPDAAAGVLPPGATMHHEPVRAGEAGLVELWPLTPPPDRPDPAAWTVPSENLNLVSAPTRLATALARWIRQETAGNVLLESRNRPLLAGDVLVLVRRRGEFARALIRALKGEGVEVAGLDRLVLAEAPAVQDLLSLCGALLLPEDDLTFASFLTSPLGGLADADLLELCPGRDRALFSALAARAHERQAWSRAAEFFASLRARADFVSPHALLVEALGPLGGRARLYARLGAEAADPVDEVLNSALRYSETDVPSLQGFVHWVERAGAEVKREADGSGGQVRVMTVHGAKGLQAPLVILPDTTGMPPEREKLFETADPASGMRLPLYGYGGDYRSAAIDALKSTRRQRDLEEHNRLLYVALTRAEDRLVVAGWALRRELDDRCWYRLVERGFARLGPEIFPFAGGWDGECMRVANAQRISRDPALTPPALPMEPLPAWAGRAPDWRPAPPPAEPPRPSPLAPSRPEGVALGPVPAAASPLARRDATGRRFRRGELVHAVLQHLPLLPPERRAEAARTYLARPANGLGPADASALAEAVVGVLAHPMLVPLFGPSSRAEVPLTGLLGNNVVGGLVDRLAVLPERVLIADFKTNRRPPKKLADTPPLYLAQMAAYRAIMRAIFPDHPVTSMLVWTETLTVHRLPDSLLDQHNPSSTSVQTSPA